MKIILCPHLLVVHVELFATCSVWGEFTWPQNALVSSLGAASYSTEPQSTDGSTRVSLSVTCRNPG